jgi:hypothetical protein
VPAATILIPLVVIAGAAAWVYHDAKTRYGTNREVVASIGALRIETPQAWAASCVAVFVLGLPLYLFARRATG